MGQQLSHNKHQQRCIKSIQLHNIKKLEEILKIHLPTKEQQYQLLSIAIENQSINIIQFCFKQKFDISGTNDDGETLLMKACRIGNATIVDTIIQHLHQIQLDSFHQLFNAETTTTGETALLIACHFATTSSHTQCINLLIQAGVDVNVADRVNGMVS